MTPAQIWFLVGLVLVLAEFVLPGVILVFIGLGAWVASLFAWMGWANTIGAQMAIFAVASLVLLIALRRLFKSWLMGFSKRNPDLSQDLDDYLGKPVRVVAAIPAGGQGKVEFKGANWMAQAGEELHPGDTAVITGREGLCLIVRRR